MKKFLIAAAPFIGGGVLGGLDAVLANILQPHLYDMTHFDVVLLLIVMQISLFSVIAGHIQLRRLKRILAQLDAKYNQK